MMLVPYNHRFHNAPPCGPFPGFEAPEHRNHCGFRTDVRDQGDSYLLEADLPGFGKENIHVELEDDTMTITAERVSETEEKAGDFVRRERRCMTRSRSFDTTGIAGWMKEIAVDPEGCTGRVKAEVIELCGKFPIYQ